MILHFKDGRSLRFIRREFHSEGWREGVNPPRSFWYVYPDRFSTPVIVKDSDIDRIEVQS